MIRGYLKRSRSSISIAVIVFLSCIGVSANMLQAQELDLEVERELVKLLSKPRKVKFPSPSDYYSDNSSAMPSALRSAKNSDYSSLFKRCVQCMQDGNPAEAERLAGVFKKRCWMSKVGFLGYYGNMFLGDTYRDLDHAKLALRAYERADHSGEGMMCATCFAIREGRKEGRIRRLIKSNPDLKRSKPKKKLRERDLMVVIKPGQLETLGLEPDTKTCIEGIIVAIQCLGTIELRPEYKLKVTVMDPTPLRKYGISFQKHDRLLLQVLSRDMLEIRPLLKLGSSDVVTIPCADLRRLPVKQAPSKAKVVKIIPGKSELHSVASRVKKDLADLRKLFEKAKREVENSNSRMF